MIPKKGDGFAELYGIPPVSGAKYYKDGAFYNAKLQRIDPSGMIEEKESEPEKKTEFGELVPESELTIPPPPPPKNTGYESDLEIVDRIKIKGAADPDFLTKADIKKELKSLGQKFDPKALRDDLLCQLKEAMGLTGASFDKAVDGNDEPVVVDPDPIEIEPDFEDI